MNNTLHTIYNRRAVRKYSDKPIDRLIIEQLLDAGRMAPSALNKQPWRFYILSKKSDIQDFAKEIGWAATKEISQINPNEALKEGTSLFRLSHQVDFYKQGDIVFHEAPVVIFITAPRDNKWAAIDVGMCAQNIMLAAKSIGLDSCPVGLGSFVEKTLIFSRLEISSSDQVMLAIAVGYGAEEPKPHERNQNNAIFI